MNIMCPSDMHVVKDIYGGFKKVYFFHDKVYLCWEGFHLPIMPKLKEKPTLHIRHDLKKSLAQFKILQCLFTPT